MKLKNYTLLIAALLIIFSGCKKDEADNKPQGNLEYSTNKYTLSDGLFVDYGPSQYFGPTNTHYNQDFFLTDGTFEFDAQGDIEDIKGKVAVYFYLESAGNTSFKSGTYTFIDDSNDATLTDAQLKVKYENKSFIVEGFIITGTVDNGSLSTQTEDYIKSGTIAVSGTKPNYTFTFDLVTESNKTIKGTYTDKLLEIK